MCRALQAATWQVCPTAGSPSWQPKDKTAKDVLNIVGERDFYSCEGFPNTKYQKCHNEAGAGCPYPHPRNSKIPKAAELHLLLPGLSLLSSSLYIYFSEYAHKDSPEDTRRSLDSLQLELQITVDRQAGTNALLWEQQQAFFSTVPAHSHL